MRKRLFATTLMALLSLFVSVNVLAYETSGVIQATTTNYKIYWSISEDGVLTIKPEEKCLWTLWMPNWDNKDNKSPWAGNPAIKEVTADKVYGSDLLANIGDYAFYGCKNLTKVNLPSWCFGSESVVGKYAFYGCNLKEADLISIKAVIGEYAFAENTSLSKVNISIVVKKIEPYAFYNCDLREFDLPYKVQTVGDCAFKNNKNLSKLTFVRLTNYADGDPHVESIGKEAFSNCAIQTLNFPSSLTSVGDNAFEYNDLDTLHIPGSLTSISSSSFRGNPHLKEIVVADTNKVYSSRDSQGNECNALIETDSNGRCLRLGCVNTTIPDDVYSISSGAFENVAGLKHITIPESVSIIWSNAFLDCADLTRVTIVGDTYIYTNFWGCHLNCVELKTDVVPTKFIPNNFGDLQKPATLLLPDEATVNQFKANEKWSAAFKYIQVPRTTRVFAEFDKTAMSLKFHYSDLHDGVEDDATVIDDLPDNFKVYTDVNSQLTQYVEGTDPYTKIKSIDFAPSFSDCKRTSFKEMLYKLEKLTQLNHLEYLNTSSAKDMIKMFYGCSSLTNLDLTSFNTSKVENFESMFSGCTALTNLNLSKFDTSNATNFSRMFTTCKNLVTLDLSNFNTAKATDFSYMFWQCYELKNLNLSSFNTEKATTMESMFRNCTELETLDLSSFSTPSLKKCNFMFVNMSSNCGILVSNNFDLTNVDYTDGNYMFGDDFYNKYNDTTYARYDTDTGLLQKKVGMLDNRPLGAHGSTLAIDNLELTDGSVLTLTEPVEVRAASYSRTMSNHWGTLCLPYPINTADAGTNCRFYGIESLDDVLTLKGISGEISAGTPVIFCRKSDTGKATIAGKGQLVSEPVNATEGDRLVGTFSTQVIAPDNYFIAADKFRLVSVANKVKVAAYRAYITKGKPAYSASFDIVIGGEATGIDAADALDDLNNAEAEYYTVDGRRINGLQKGMNIVKVGSKVRKVYVK